MSKKDFDDFINKQAAKKSQEEPINWDNQRDEWLNYLSEYYSKAEEFLKEYIEDNKVSIKYTDKEIYEEYIGGYTVKVLNIELAGHKVKLEPIGTNLIGAKGRVDLIGKNGTIRFVLVNKNSSGPKIKVNIWIEGEEPPKQEEVSKILEWEWKISTPPPRIKYI
jgi:hypothetical protein